MAAQRTSMQRGAAWWAAPVYRVGEPFATGRAPIEEGSWYACGHQGHTLTLVRSRVDSGMCRAIRSGEARFGLVVEPPLILFAFQFEGLDEGWGDAPFAWPLLPAAERIVPPRHVRPEERDLLWITLVGLEDGLIHAQRGVTLSPAFTRELRAAIRRQARIPFDAARYALATVRAREQGVSPGDSPCPGPRAYFCHAND